MFFPSRLAAARSFRSVIAIVGLIAGVALLNSASVNSAKRQPAQRAPVSAATQWYRGNTHTHTSNSDGDSSPELVAARYKSLGYNFVIITDHNKLTEVDSLNEQLGEPGSFLVMKGEVLVSPADGGRWPGKIDYERQDVQMICSGLLPK